MQRVGFAIAIIGVGAAIVVIILCRNAAPPIPLYSAVGLLASAGIAALINSINLVIKGNKFNARLAKYISIGKSLYKKRNSHGVSSKNYMEDTKKLISEIADDLIKNRSKADVDRVVGGLNFDFVDLDSINESEKEKYNKGQIGNVIASLVDNLIQLQEREKK